MISLILISHKNVILAFFASVLLSSITGFAFFHVFMVNQSLQNFYESNNKTKDIPKVVTLNLLLGIYSFIWLQCNPFRQTKVRPDAPFSETHFSNLKA